MRLRSLVLVAALAAAACSSPTADDATGGGAGDGGGAAAAPKFVGTYEVPVRPELAAAATFPVEEVEWSTAAGVASLSYALPRGLVGQSLRVSFTGPYDPAATELHLTGPAGTAVCIVSDSLVSCYEEMYGLMPIETDYEEVEEVAIEEYPGAVSDRIEVAQIFESDPIGIADFDLDKPAVPHAPDDD